MFCHLEREQAMDVFRSISYKSSMFSPNITAKIFFVKQETVFIKYADEEAEAYYKKTEEDEKK